MLSNRPYLLRAFYQWIVDSGCTPILVIDAAHPRCKIPQDFAEDGEIIFNISPVAVRDLKITNEFLDFKASFSGVIHFISAPVKAILAVYAEENGEGLFLDAEDAESGEATSPPNLTRYSNTTPVEPLSQANTSVPAAAKSKPFLKLVE